MSFFFQAEDGIRDGHVTGVQTCALPISLLGFADGEVRVLVSKPSIAGMGLNFQSCHNMVFAGLSYSYESYYQAIRRCWRFGQTQSVNCYVIATDSQQANVDTSKDNAEDEYVMYGQKGA